MRLAMDGHGILLRSWWDAQHSLATGDLLHVLPDWQAPDGDIFAVWHAVRLKVMTTASASAVLRGLNNAFMLNSPIDLLIPAGRNAEGRQGRK